MSSRTLKHIKTTSSGLVQKFVCGILCPSRFQGKEKSAGVRVEVEAVNSLTLFIIDIITCVVKTPFLRSEDCQPFILKWNSEAEQS